MNYTQETQLSLFTPQQEVESYLNCDAGGFFSLLLGGFPDGNRQISYPLETMPMVLDLIDHNRDTWISQASFYKRNRRVVNLKSVGLSFLDIDCYKLDWAKNMTAEQMAYRFVEYCRQQGVPEPSLIVYSGRGLQPKWFFMKAVPRLALPRWNALQKELLHRMQVYGADPLARDASRVLRLVETVNTKSGRYCHVVWVKNDSEGKPYQYDFDEFCSVVLPFSRQEIKAIKEAQEVRLLKNRLHPRVSLLTLQTLNWNRLEDLRKLCQMRGCVPEGERMITLFMQMNFLALSNQISLSSFFQEARQLANQIDPQWSYESSALSTLYQKFKDALTGKRVEFQGEERTPLYTPSNSTIIEWFHITDDEMRNLTTIISTKIKQERSKERRAKERKKSGVLVRSEYEQNAKNRQELVLELKAKGISQADIVRQTGLSRMTIYRYINQGK